MEENYLKEREAYDKVREELDHTLGISFCKLMELYPLYDHRVEQLNADAVLSVVLVGRGQPLELLRDKVLSNGQLLKTALDVTVVTPEPKADLHQLLTLAPELHRFIRIRSIDRDQCVTEQPKPQWEQGTLTYEWGSLTDDGLRTIMSRHASCTYFIFDETLSKLAAACAKDKKRVVACIQKQTISVQAPEDPEPTSVTQHALSVLSPKRTVLDCVQGDKFLKQIESIAYNLCYAYTKGNNPHATTEEIKTTFKKPYDYESNIECAVHIRSKLRCCGIENWYEKSAARRFAELLEADKKGELVEELSCLEHRRWCISKLVQGFQLPPDLSNIYSDTRIGTHDEKKKWHACLVPYRDSRALEESDWIAEDPDSLEKLDELDRQTLRIHRTCGQRLETASEKIEEYLADIKTYDGISQVPPKQDPSAQYHQLHKHVRDLSNAVSLLRKGDADAMLLYNRSIAGLLALTKNMDEDAKKKLNITLDKLAIHVGIWIEFVTRKDYKEQNRVLIRQIPFALSKFQDLTLVKLLSDKKEDCLSAAWQLEPSRVIFVDFADSVEDLVRIWQMSKQIDYFLEHCCNQIQSEYHIFLCGDIRNMKREYPEFFEKFDCRVHPVASCDTNQIRPEFVELMRESGADYIDMTGGKPELISIADGFARNSHVGAFIIRNEQLRSFYGADAIHGRLLNKGLSVREVFAQSGAAAVKSDGEKLVGRIEQDYVDFWNIASSHGAYWHGFCMKFISKVCNAAEAAAKAAKRAHDPLLLPDVHIAAQLAALRSVQAKTPLERELPGECEEILAKLADKHLIVKCPEGYRVTSQELMSALVNSGKVLEYFIYFSAGKCAFTDVVMSYQFKHSEEDKAVQNELDVICSKDVRTLFISAKNVSAEKSESKTFLKHVCYEVEALARRFGINPKQLLAVPNARQFENGKLSEAADYCMQRGVYMLGKECCKPGVLEKVLVKIMNDDQDWCKWLLETA